MEWIKDGKTVRPDSRHKVEHDGDLCALTILRVNAGDVGEYTVVLKNDAGQSSSTASLLVEGRFRRLFFNLVSYFRKIK